MTANGFPYMGVWLSWEIHFCKTKKNKKLELKNAFPTVNESGNAF